MGRIKLTPEQRVLAAEKVVELIEKDGSAAEGDIKNCITSTLHLGVFPKPDYGKILFTARVKKVQGRYYLMGTGPKKPKEEKTLKIKKSSQEATSQSITFEGSDLVVTVKGGGHDFKSRVVKVTVFISCLAGLFAVVNIF